MRRRRFFVFAALWGLCRPNSGTRGSCFGAFFLPRAGIYSARKRYISVLISFPG